MTCRLLRSIRVMLCGAFSQKHISRPRTRLSIMGAVGKVVQLPGDGEDPRPGLLAEAGIVPEGERDGRVGNSGLLRDVSNRRFPVHRKCLDSVAGIWYQVVSSTSNRPG